MAKKLVEKVDSFNKPPFRKLRGYAFDPMTSLELSTSQINEIIYKVPWEDNLQPGPEGDYIKVLDRDPESGVFYTPVNLNDPIILATDGLGPSETNPQFHQQMVYAVIMTTIKIFEKALGRKVMWSHFRGTINKKFDFHFIEKLIVYPHALRTQNAYYSPERKALLFGYYNATPINSSVYMPDGIVFSCLSHDIVAHETTHALLDGVYSRFMESTNPDVPAFHEGFSDIVALFQHFTHAEIVRNQIREVRGMLDAENLLAKLAVEFGKSTGEYSSLRDFIGTEHKGKWKRRPASTTDYNEVLECHDRGALLVSAVFDAFLTIYSHRTADLLRLATGGTGVLPQGDLHPDLINRLADEASKSASHVLNMCVRALDYCPPIDITFGDFLRAVITADKELVPDDNNNYRIAFINAFKKRGIYPDGVPNLSVETLCYNTLDNSKSKGWFSESVFDLLKNFKAELAYVTNRKEIFERTSDFIGGKKIKIKGKKRQNQIARDGGFYAVFFGKDWKPKDAALFETLTGLVVKDFKTLGIKTSNFNKSGPSIEMQIRINNRTGPDGTLVNQIVMTLNQRCDVQALTDEADNVSFSLSKKGNYLFKKQMIFRGGCTLIFDLDSLRLKHVISKPIFEICNTESKRRRKITWNASRLKMQYECMHGKYLDQLGFAPGLEPLAQIHNSKTIIT